MLPANSSFYQDRTSYLKKVAGYTEHSDFDGLHARPVHLADNDTRIVMDLIYLGGAFQRSLPRSHLTAKAEQQDFASRILPGY